MKNNFNNNLVNNLTIDHIQNKDKHLKNVVYSNEYLNKFLNLDSILDFNLIVYFSESASKVNLHKFSDYLIETIQQKNVSISDPAELLEGRLVEKYNLIVASTVIMKGEFNKKFILDNLPNLEKISNINIYKINIIYVYFDEFFDIGVKEEILENGKYKLYSIHMNINYLIENYDLILSKYKSQDENNSIFKTKSPLDFNPIFIFKGMTWSNIIYIFRLYGYSINGGRITRRHLLSIIEMKLSIFMLISGVYKTNQILYPNKSNKLYFDSRIEKNYIQFIRNGEYDENFIHENPVILEYYLLNEKYTIKLKLQEIKNNIDSMTKLIELSINSINTWNLEIDPSSGAFLDSHSKFENIDKHNIKKKDKITITGEMKKKLRKQDKLKIIIWNEKIKLENFQKSLNVLIESKKTLENDLVSIIDLKEEILSKKSIELRNSILSSRSFKLKSLNLRRENKESNRNYSTMVNQDSMVTNSDISVIPKSSISETNKDIEENIKSKLISYPWYSKNKRNTKKTFYSDKVNNNSFINIDSPLYNELYKILLKGPINEDTQLKIEDLIFNQGSILLKDRLEEEKDINYSLLNHNYQIINKIKEQIPFINSQINFVREDHYKILNRRDSKNVRNFKRFNDLINHKSLLDNKRIYGVLLGRLLRILSNLNLNNNNTNFTSNAMEIGMEIIEYKNYSEYQEYLKLNKHISYSQWKEGKDLDFSNKSYIFYVGFQLLNILVELGILELGYIIVNKKETHILMPGSVFKDILSDFKDNILMLDLPLKLPMIVKPKEYKREIKDDKTNEILGGYLLNDTKITTPLIIENPELKCNSEIRKENKIYNMVNSISSVSYKINTDVLEFIILYSEKFNLFPEPKNLDVILNKIKRTTLEKKELESFLSLRRLEMNILSIAQIYSLVSEFYFPVRIDSRGRLYCYSDYLNYQSIELAKALLNFAEGNKINSYDKNALNFIKIYGANNYGNKLDKLSFQKRIEWVNKNEEDILNFENGNLLKQAENKFLFIAFCLEYKKIYHSFINGKTYYTSFLPIELDATCNGFQHLAMFTGFLSKENTNKEELNLFKNLNLTSSTWDDKPEDFYSIIAISLKMYFTNHIKELENKVSCIYEVNVGKEINKEEQNNIQYLLDSYYRLSNVDIKREWIKKSAMTKVYNVTLFSMSNYIKELFDYREEDAKYSTEKWYVNKKDSNVKLKGVDIKHLARAIDNVVYLLIPKFGSFNKYLKEIAKISVALQLPIPWQLPSGFNIFQSYIESKTERLKPFRFRSNSFSIKIADKTKFNKQKQIRALMPNLVHSLDATSLALLTDLYFKGNLSDNKNLYAVHDCFAVTANHLEFIIDHLKLVYLTIYTNDNYIISFDKGIKDYIKMQLGNHFDVKSRVISINNLEIKFPDISEVINNTESDRDYSIFTENIKNASYLIQ